MTNQNQIDEELYPNEEDIMDDELTQEPKGKLGGSAGKKNDKEISKDSNSEKDLGDTQMEE